MNSPAIDMSALTRPCPHCPDLRAAVAMLIDRLIDAGERVEIWGERMGGDGQDRLRPRSLELRCIACRGAGRVLTDEGIALVALLPPDMRGGPAPHPDADIPF